MLLLVCPGASYATNSYSGLLVSEVILVSKRGGEPDGGDCMRDSGATIAM